MALSMHQIEPCRFYEIIPAKLAREHPDQLKQIRILMVSWKTESIITVRYPSASSLRTHFNGEQNTSRKTLLPAFDEMYEMDVGVANEVFVKRFEGNDELMGALLTSWSSIKKGSCWFELKSSDMVNWGKRKVQNFNEEEGGGGGGGDEESERVLLSPKKRKRNGKDNMKNKKARSDEPRKNQATNAGKKTKNIKNSRSRWSEERYKSAEQSMLKVMKEKGAVFSKPILRSELKGEARKLIGDTGLLDHLLKHMAGKMVLGGEERLQRRYNADGFIEYWLESADLMTIRKDDDGVEDPCWITPPGWQPGGCPSQDPVCAREIKKLEQRVDELERLVKKLMSEKQEGHRDQCLKECYASELLR